MFPIPRCDDAVSEIGPDAKYFLSMDLDAGYWQVRVEEESKPKLAFFTPQGKKHWNCMPMGVLNAQSVFAAMMITISADWMRLAALADLSTAGSKVIVDDVLLYAKTIVELLAFFRIVLGVLRHYSATVKLKKCKFMPDRCEFVGVDVLPEGNSPAKSKHATFASIPSPESWSDLRMIIGMFGFYSQWLYNYEVRIKPWRELQRRQPDIGTPTDEERLLMQSLWTKEHEALLEELKNDIMSNVVLARPNPEKRFYIKTDWSKTGYGAVLLQAGDDEDSKEAERSEAAGGLCLFDRTKGGLRLHPVAFISRSTTDGELNWHSYVGEAAVGRWAFQKWNKWLLGRDFTWLCDCNGLKRFFEAAPDGPTGMIQRWRAELLQF